MRRKSCQAAFVFLCCCCGEREATDQSWQTALAGPEATWIFRFITLFSFLSSPLFILHFHCLNSIKHFRRAGWLDWGRCKHMPTGKDKCVFTRTSASGLMTRCHDRREPKLRWTFWPLRASWDLPATHSNWSSQPLDPSHHLYVCVLLSVSLTGTSVLTISII